MAVKQDKKINFEEEFCDAVKYAYAKNVLKSNRFFSEWFRKRGKAFFFLFKKNLSTTDIQFAELMSLLQVHVKECNGKLKGLQFITLKDFLRNYDELFSDFQSKKNKVNVDELAGSLLKLYAPKLRRQIVVELFFGSCTVFLPPHIELDLAAVCRESGYIHSCGRNVYTRRLEEIDGNDLITTLNKYITSKPSRKSKSPSDMKSYVQVYSHEDFTAYDRRYTSELRGGLDDTKIYVEKYYIGKLTFVSFLDKLQEKLKDIIVMPVPGPYRKQREEALKREDLDKTYTIWFMIDRALSDVSTQPGESRFLICYDQGFRNYNPFHIFDENKPAWVAHTTIPHTLAGAMINITRPWWDEKKEKVLIADPFSGTGTIWLEAQKFLNIKTECSDVSPVCSLLADDNRYFFTRNSEQLNYLKKYIKDSVDDAKELISPLDNRSKQKKMGYHNAFNFFDTIKKKYGDEPISFDESDVKELKKLTFEDRMLFYLCMRTHIRRWGALHRGFIGWGPAFTQEQEVLLHQIEQLSDMRELWKNKLLKNASNFIEFIGTYSVGISINLPESQNDIKGLSVKDMSVKEKRQKKVDVIITDPPYGYNTDEDFRNLAVTYSCALRNMISMFKDRGQLVIAVPEKTFTGRKVATYATKGWLTQQILAEARFLGYEVVVGAQVFPRPGRIFWQPYYWESERALRRTILHFRFQRLSEEN